MPNTRLKDGYAHKHMFKQPSKCARTLGLLINVPLNFCALRQFRRYAAIGQAAMNVLTWKHLI